MMQGLKSMLESIIPFADITIYPTTADLQADNAADKYYHYFIAPPAFQEKPEFFAARKSQTILLCDGQSEQGIPPAVHRINMLTTADELLKQLLVIQQHAHSSYSRYPHTIAGQLKQRDQQHMPQLSNREIDVLRLLACGHINKEIADQLHISINTVITHRKNIMQKLDSQSLSKLVIYAVQHGYISADDIK